jgi:hypothetical protein
MFLRRRIEGRKRRKGEWRWVAMGGVGMVLLT